ncbi:leucyl aminopeptidase [Rhizobium sp. EC-SD404]|uniref:leucyl aminopeptidase n=1 Tax=Rhizobium sp. EC-SD404 TaxID=2038389 RepID=UPI001255285F|nr:leucyl aminopeptidase [Rhizobium sp. EC-SD404]VVT16075.1 putative cytosol aminopeptidase [Rhizobium sp. EC-SD404]
MTRKLSIAFAKSAKSNEGVAVFLAPAKDRLPASLAAVDPGGVVAKAAEIAEFSGKSLSAVDVLAPVGATMNRIMVLGTGETPTHNDWTDLGGALVGRLKSIRNVTVYLDVDGVEAGASAAANLALGMTLRNYSFDGYKTKKKDDENGKSEEGDVSVTIVTADAAAAKKAYAEFSGTGEGVLLARDLVNEPANVLGPVEFAKRASELEALGVDIEILTEKDMKKLGMGAFLGVSQGSSRPPRIVIMRWNGGEKNAAPIAFIGKGVVFDSGGISIKPSAGMEDMKGDMGGAAAVTGLMHALASRKAKANVVGMIGLVENMPDANAQRPGDIVTSMSGQTIEVINTDAEGRLILCDMLWYCNDRFKPGFMINLATLTGAILVALGNLHAGLFSNDDVLAERLAEAGETTREKVWRMPLGKDYDKMIDSRFADMKNTGGRYAGSITAAQFLQRFVGKTPWAHLDIAGTAMSSPQTEINRSWGSGYGVRLLNELVRAHYEN